MRIAGMTISKMVWKVFLGGILNHAQSFLIIFFLSPYRGQRMYAQAKIMRRTNREMTQPVMLVPSLVICLPVFSSFSALVGSCGC